jgi:ubiquinone/menaquinone biosynthesis C-methylase UbiE
MADLAEWAPDVERRNEAVVALVPASPGGACTRVVERTTVTRHVEVDQAGIDLLGRAFVHLRCLACAGPVSISPEGLDGPPGRTNGRLGCDNCGATYPVERGIVRMVDASALPEEEREVRRRTAESFAYEWQHFGELKPEWERNFIAYMEPHEPRWFADRVMLDVGAGSGRHSYHAARLGAVAAAVDIGEAIDVARANLPTDVLTVQADAEALPFTDEAFDLVAAIGVLHHLPDPERALRKLYRLVKPGGFVQIYVYWLPDSRWQRGLLGAIEAIRVVTTRLPKALLRLASYPIAAAAYALFVFPHRALGRTSRGAAISRRLPLGAYTEYPFGVCVNDQFDRFSAPLERRFKRKEVEQMLRAAGFEEIRVFENHGWTACGRRPVDATPSAPAGSTAFKDS